MQEKKDLENDGEEENWKNKETLPDQLPSLNNFIQLMNNLDLIKGGGFEGTTFIGNQFS